MPTGEPWDKNPRRWEGMPFIEDFALRRGYHSLIHGKGGPIGKMDFVTNKFLGCGRSISSSAAPG